MKTNTIIFEKIVNGEPIHCELHCMKSWNAINIAIFAAGGWSVWKIKP